MNTRNKYGNGMLMAGMLLMLVGIGKFFILTVVPDLYEVVANNSSVWVKLFVLGVPLAIAGSILIKGEE